MKKSVAVTIISILAIAVMVLGVLSYVNDRDRCRTIEKLNAKVTAGDARIDVLTADITERDARIETLNADIADRDARIGTLTADVAGRDAQIETLNADTAAKDGLIEALTADIAARDAQIETLTAGVAGRDEQIDTLNAEITARGGLIEAMTADIAARDAQIEVLTADIAARDARIGTLTADVSDRDARIETLTDDIADRDAQIETLTADVAGRDARIETLTTDVAGRDAEIETLTVEIDAKEKQIRGQAATIDEQASIISDQADIISGQEKKLNYSGMAEEALLAVVDEITPPLERLGYIILVRDYNSRPVSPEMPESSVECAFLTDLVQGLENRWAASNQCDISAMSDQQFIDCCASWVMLELDHLGKYTGMEFSDPVLADYADRYIAALQDQYTAVMDFYGKDDGKYDEYWSAGYQTGARMIYWMNRKYGLSVSEQYREKFAGLIEDGKFADRCVSIQEDLTSQLEALDPGLTGTAGGSAKTRPFTLKNNTAYTIDSLTVFMCFYDSEGEQVGRNLLCQKTGIASGSEIKVDSTCISVFFDRCDFEVEFSVSGTASWLTHQDLIRFKSIPEARFSWNGTVMKDGQPASGQPVLVLENLTAGWETNHFWNESLYVPSLTFSVRNTGDADAEIVTVHVIFTDRNQKEVWDEEIVCVVGSSDGALKPGFSKKTSVRSSVGFETIPADIPPVTADIYINGMLIQTVEIAERNGSGAQQE